MMDGEEKDNSSLSYTRGTSEVPLLGKCIGEVLDYTARRYPDRDCLIVRHQQQRFIYAQFRSAVEGLARGLLSLGVNKGDRVGIWSPNCSEWVTTQFATAKIGAILVNINPLNRRSEVEYVLRQSGCQFLLLAEGFRDIDYIQILQELSAENAAKRSGNFGALANLRAAVLFGSKSIAGTLSWSEVIARGQRVPLESLRSRESELDFDDAINIQYTSGTTGFPKGATLSHHNIVNNGLLIARRMRFSPLDRLCIPVPFYHCFGMVLANMACVVTGATMVVPAASFDPLSTLAAVEEERCTALHGVPTMFIAELEHPRFKEFDLSTLRTGIMAGSPCPVEVMKRVMNDMHCPELTIAYGLTEASPVISQTTPEDPIEVRISTVGKALPHTEVKIVDPASGKIVPLGTPGELCTRGYHVMKGYYRDPHATRAAIEDTGWLHTADIAVMDENGYFKITGRAKDVIIRGGENIYPREIEEFLHTHPSISAVQVIGIPDPKYGECVAAYGECVAAWIKLRGGCTLSLEDVERFCKGKIADFKISRHLKITDDFPMTVTGKIQKFRMREITIQELGLEQPAKGAIGTVK
jgi:fatty-acyl-CoA synthase